MGITSKIKGLLLRPYYGILQSVSSSKHSLEFAQRKVQIDHNMLFCTEPGVTSERYCDHDIIVSLTTYGRRIHSVYMAIESLMEQTMKPNRIILWLDDSFEGKRLPESINKLRKRGLEVAFCKDVRSYKKLVPALCKYPDDAIITADDDIVYDVNMLENLIVPYIENPHAIYCNRAHKMVPDGQGKLLPYNSWEWCSRERGFSPLFFPTGVGGALYPPHSLDEEVKNEEVFMQICPAADDVWFKAMSLKKGTPVCHVETRHANGEEYLLDGETQDMGLANQNVGQSMNDPQLDAVFTQYDLYRLVQHHVEETGKGSAR